MSHPDVMPGENALARPSTRHPWRTHGRPTSQVEASICEVAFITAEASCSATITARAIKSSHPNNLHVFWAYLVLL